MTDSPEIKRLREDAIETPHDGRLVPWGSAIQAVRDTEVRVREERAVDFRPVSIESARREAFREAVEALRGMHYHDYLDAEAAAGRELQSDEFKDAADFIERSFLSPDNPEADDEAVGEAIDDLGAASLRAAFDEVCDELDNPEGNA